MCCGGGRHCNRSPRARKAIPAFFSIGVAANTHARRAVQRRAIKLLAEARVPNIMKRAMRCHDFGSGREASRSQYREYWQGERQSPGPKLVPAPWITVESSD